MTLSQDYPAAQSTGCSFWQKLHAFKWIQLVYTAARHRLQQTCDGSGQHVACFFTRLSVPSTGHSRCTQRLRLADPAGRQQHTVPSYKLADIPNRQLHTVPSHRPLLAGPPAAPAACAGA